MLRSMYVVTGVSALLALSVACGHQNAAPVSPSSVNPTSSDENTGSTGETLKVTAPNLISPGNNALLSNTTVTLEWTASTGLNTTSGLPLNYDYEVYDPDNVKVKTGFASSTSVVLGLDFEKRYTWRVRATASFLSPTGAPDIRFGPWSTTWTLETPTSQGYIRGNELYDPLINGKTVGSVFGPYHFTPNGISLDSLESFVAYQLPQTLIAGEFSMLVTNLRTSHEGGKTKMMSMAEGYDDITTNNRRATFEKRSDGTMAWRIITHDDQIETGSAERIGVRYNLVDTFAFKMAWRPNLFQFSANRFGPDGPLMYFQQKSFRGAPYDPNPHVIYLGGPGGRAGADSGSVPNMIIRQVWVSPNPRPLGINQ